MKILGPIAVILTLLVCIGLLVLGARPGVLDDVIVITLILGMLGTMILLPFAALAGVVVLWICLWKREFPLPRFKLQRLRSLPWKSAGMSLGLLLATGMLLVLRVPMKLAFEGAKPQLEHLLQQLAAQPPEHQRSATMQKAGRFNIDEYAADPRGGIYFRTYTSIIIHSPDTISWGFAYRPNQQGSPFGAADYMLIPLGNDWYCFRANNDWH